MRAATPLAGFCALTPSRRMSTSSPAARSSIASPRTASPTLTQRPPGDRASNEQASGARTQVRPASSASWMSPSVPPRASRNVVARRWCVCESLPPTGIIGRCCATIS
ncbi:MAG: hypothetical protein ACMG6S_22060 [Byssovorax sp.]